MARISELPAADPLDGTEQTVVVQGGVTKRALLPAGGGGGGVEELVVYDDFKRADTTGSLGTPTVTPGAAWVSDTSLAARHQVVNNRGRRDIDNLARSMLTLDALPAVQANGNVASDYRVSVKGQARQQYRLEVCRLDADNLYWAGFNTDIRRFQVISVIEGVTTTLYDNAGVHPGAYSSAKIELHAIVRRYNLFGNEYVTLGFWANGMRGAIYGFQVDGLTEATSFTGIRGATGNFGVYNTNIGATIDEFTVTRRLA